jgi:hypothetical protein
MFEFLRRWCDAIHQFGLETVRLQNYCAIPYLMAVNSLFWSVSQFYANLLYYILFVIPFTVLYVFMPQKKLNSEPFMA